MGRHSAPSLFHRTTEGAESYVSKLRKALPRAAFLLLVAASAAWHFSVDNYADQRDSNVSTLSREFSFSHARTERNLDKIRARFFMPNAVLRDAERITVECILGAGVITSAWKKGPLQRIAPGGETMFLVGTAFAGIVADAQGLISLPEATMVAAACFYGVYSILGAFFRFFWYEGTDDLEPRRNRLGLFVLFVLMKAQLCLFQATVWASVTCLQATSTFKPDPGRWGDIFESARDVPTPDPDRPDDDDLNEPMDEFEASAAAEDGPQISKESMDQPTDEDFFFTGLLDNGRRRKNETFHETWEGRAATNMNSVQGSGIFDGDHADEDRAHAATCPLPSWMANMFTKSALVASLGATYAKVRNLMMGQTLAPRPGLVWVVWLRVPRMEIEELPPLFVSDFCRPFKVLGSYLGFCLAMYMEVRRTSLHLLLCIAYTMRWRWNSRAPPSGIVDCGRVAGTSVVDHRYHVPSFSFDEPAPKHIIAYLYKFILWCWIVWPALFLGFAYRAALYDRATGNFVADSGASRRGSTKAELPAFPARVVLHDDPAAYLADQRPFVHVLNIEALRPCLRELQPAQLLARMLALS